MNERYRAYKHLRTKYGMYAWEALSYLNKRQHIYTLWVH